MATKNEKLMMSADDFKKAFFVDDDRDEIRFGVDGKVFVDFAAVQRGIDNAPAVYAEKVVHGQWEDKFGGAFANPRFRCSVCKEEALYRIERDFLGAWKNVQALTPRCPFCGAVLDGGKTDGK